MTTRITPNESEANPTPGEANGKPKRTRSAATRLRIIRAAKTLITDQGYVNVSLDDIAAAAGISRQTIYMQFGSKSGLLGAFIEEDEESGLREVRDANRAAKDPVALLNKVIPLDMELMRRNYKLFRVFYAQAVNDPDFQAFWERVRSARRTSMRRGIEWLFQEGKLADGWTVDQATDWLYTVTDYQMYEGLVVRAGWSMDELNRRMRETVFAVLIKDGTPYS